MGRNKAFLAADGETLAERAARLLSAVCDDVVEAGPGHSSLRSVREDPPGAGPSAALVAGADALRADAVLLLAVDMPNVSVPLLELLRDHSADCSVVPEAGGRLQVACCRYSAEAVARAREACVPHSLDTPGLHDVVRSAPYAVVGSDVWGAVADADAFTDLDTPDDLARHEADDPRRGRHR